ncbi:alpha-hydroxy acid oxidase [Amaricoccus solimangrovi]|uniref:Alpha-hydroxy-acid oxidizing protein n=1 Tax=Amaricoccus solimangrovi TaxID=2589815 RepID=A0A501WEM7_9RHOB|nr:alpha-hydroxy acid oxidase [Amaricoccus solimangrovi]TPE48039.1 alpha-hydroxy-acid oxidizing protein [Amaricoccus solimangrovi]
MGEIPSSLRAAVRDRIGPELERYLEGRPRDMDPGASDPNEAAFDAYRLVPRLLTGIADTDIGVDWLGHRVAAPLLVGAFAADRILDPMGVVPIARAAGRLRLPIVISEECLTPLPEITAVNGCVALQLRGAGPLDRALALAGHAADSGARGIVLTALAPAHPRPGLFPGGLDIQAATRERGLRPIAAEGGDHTVHASPAWSWADLAAFVAEAAALGLPVHLKGVLDPADAARALDAGCAGVAISNLGVRNLYRWAPAVARLPTVAAAVGTRGAVVLDGGVRNAADAVVAACLGADLVTMVRPIVYMAIAEGEDAVGDFLSKFLDDFYTICFWMGVDRVGAFSSDHVTRL